MSRQKSFNSFPSKTFIQILYVSIECYIKQCQTQMILNCVTNVPKPNQNFDFLETAHHFRFVWFKEFSWVCYSRWVDRIYCLPCALFGHKNVAKHLQKTISNIVNSSQNIQRTSTCPNRNTEKEANI